MPGTRMERMIWFSSWRWKMENVAFAATSVPCTFAMSSMESPSSLETSDDTDLDSVFEYLIVGRELRLGFDRPVRTKGRIKRNQQRQTYQCQPLDSWRFIPVIHHWILSYTSQLSYYRDFLYELIMIDFPHRWTTHCAVTMTGTSIQSKRFLTPQLGVQDTR